MPLVIFNMWLTRHTYEKHNSDQPHLNFCTVVGGTPKLRQHSKSITVFYPAKKTDFIGGPPSCKTKRCSRISGWSSFMVPSLATFFGQTSSKRNLNYHFKHNILATNLFFGLIFAGLLIHVNVGQNRLKRNHLMSCYNIKDKLSNEDLSLSAKLCSK